MSDPKAVFINGAIDPITAITNTSFVSGRVGLYSASAQTFDNFVVQSYPATVAVFPPLRATRQAASQVSIDWPTNVDGFHLESASQVPSPFWSNVTNPPVIEDHHYRILIPPADTRQFFRLHQH